MKKTPFYNVHTKLEAKIVKFAGYMMPVQYTSIIEEHNRVRQSVGMFDVSHMGEIEIRGKDAKEYVQYITVNDINKLEEGRAQYTAMLFENGGIIDDLLVYNCGDYFMLVVNAANKDKDLKWIQENVKGDAVVNDVSEKTALIAVQGPKSIDVLQKLTDVNLSEIKFYRFTFGKLAGYDMIISRTGYTGELGFEFYMDSGKTDCEAVWDAIAEAGKDEEIGPAGLGARDTLRLEMGYLLYGNDMDENANPFEAGLGWITKLDKGDFIGREALLEKKNNGIKRTLVGLKLTDPSIAKRAIPRHGYSIVKENQNIGTVTSGTLSPTLGTSIGLGYIPTEDKQVDSTLEISIRGTNYPFKIVKPPFIKR